MCIEGGYEALDRFIRALQKVQYGLFSVSLVGEEVLHADDGRLKVWWRTT